MEEQPVNVLIAFLIGCGVGCLAYSLAVKYGKRLMINDDKFLADILGKLPYDGLLKFQSGLDNELRKRKEPTA